MSGGAGFDNDGKVYGLLFPMGNPEKPYCWEMSFYLSERTQKTGITCLRRLMGGQCPILKFELTLSEIRERGVLVPFIPDDRAGQVDKNVVKAQWKHRGTKRPTSLRDN